LFVRDRGPRATSDRYDVIRTGCNVPAETKLCCCLTLLYVGFWTEGPLLAVRALVDNLLICHETLVTPSVGIPIATCVA